MSEVAEILRSRVGERLASLAAEGKTKRSVSLAIGAHAGYVRDLLDPERFSMPSAARIEALAQELGTTTDFLMGRADGSGRPVSEVTFRDVRPEWRGPHDGQRIPVFGTGYCDDLEVEADGNLVKVEQTLFEPEHVIQMIERPAALWAARDAYAIYFHGSSMEPRFYQGEIGIVQPSRPPGPGDFVVVQLNDGHSTDVIHVLVKRLIRSAASYVELEQFNPPAAFRIDRKRVARMHLIASPAHLYL